MAKRARKAAREPLKDLPTFALAPPNTPKWLVTHDEGHGRHSAFDLVGMDASAEPDEWKDNWGGWEWENFVLAYSAYSDDPQLVLKYFDELAAGTVDLSTSAEQSRLLAFREIQIRYKGESVWWTDLDHGSVDLVTLYDLAVFKQPRVVDGRPLWILSLSQFDNAEFPPESQGGPPYTEHVSTAREASMPSTFLEERVGKIAYSPEHTPEWLTVWPGPPGQGSKMFVEIDATGVDDELWKAWDPRPRDPQTIAFAYLQQLVIARDANWRYEASTDLSSIHSVDDRNILESIDIRHHGSPVWWVDLDDGPDHAASLFDLVNPREPVRYHGVDAYRNGKLWLMSLDQWDNAEWPAESQGGPPYTPHVSVARDNPMHAAEPPTLEPMAATKSEAAWRLAQDLLALGWTEEEDLRSKYVGPLRRRRGRRRRRHRRRR